MKKVIVAGSRNFNDYVIVKQKLDELIKEPIIIVSGCAAGPDTLGEQYADEKGYNIEKHPANWSDLNVTPCKIKYNSYGAYNALAGHNRNRDMLNSIISNADGGFVVAFWDGNSRGTANMMDISRKSGIQVIEIRI